MDISVPVLLKAVKMASPLAAIVVGGAMAWQSLKQDVAGLKADQQQTAIVRQQDHDAIVSHTQQLKDMGAQLDDIDHKLDRALAERK